MITKITAALSLVLFFSVAAFAQAPPQAFSYQAVARDASGNIIANKTVSLRFTIHDATANGANVYQETQSPTTNTLGLVNLSVGTGTVVSGTFATINWGSGPKFLQVDIDPAGGNNYTTLGTSQMLSVPYALYAGNALSAPVSKKTTVSEVDQSVALTVTPTTTFTLVPGLIDTINLTDTSEVLITTQGGIVLDNNYTNQWGYLDIAFFIDGGGYELPPAYKRIWAVNTQQGPYTNYSFNEKKVFPPGQHIIQVESQYGGSSIQGGNNISIDVGGGPYAFLRGSLIIEIFPQ